jgi:hypothetical protein
MQPRFALSTGSACHSGANEPSHVLRAAGLTDDAAFSSIRIGIGRFTTLTETESALSALLTALDSVKASANGAAVALAEGGSAATSREGEKAVNYLAASPTFALAPPAAFR